MAKDDKFRGSSGSSGRVDVDITASEDSSAPPRKRIKLNSDSPDGYGVPLQVLSLSPMSSSERKGLICRFKFELEQIRMLQNKVEMQRINAVMMMKQCETLLNRLVDHRHAWVFREPIDAVKLDIPDYLTVIKHPMDLGTIQSKLNSGSYSSPLEFAADVRLTFRNAMEYNPEGHDVHMMADCLSKLFEQRWKTIEKKIPDTEPQILQPKGHCEESQIPEVSPLNKRKIDVYKVETVTEPERRALKQNLGREHSEIELSNESGLSNCSMHQRKTSSVESNPCQYGESTSTESSQVSPDKLIRNAMIKNRFADTILKAREKALTQVDKRDQKKPRREMEELEMQKKKEKARLQAEAKAAEDAQRRAKAAEARKKRELEREAARQALLQMEKTVEIDDNLRFMEDLKILGVAPADQLPSSSTNHSQDGLASFRSDGSNRLQQLGLFLKQDEDKEAYDYFTAANHNVYELEEGEIY